MTKLIDAAFDGDIETVRQLIETYGKQKNKIKVFAEPLSVAALMGNVEIVRLFIDSGANINCIREEGTALHYAIRGIGMPAHIIGENLRNFEVARVLIEAGTDLSLRDNPKDLNYKGWTALMTSACHGRATIAKMLIESGSDINGRDNTGRTPLIIAADFASVTVTELLIQAGASIDIKDDRGLTAYDYVIKDVDIGAAQIAEELQPIQAFQNILANPLGSVQTMVPNLLDLWANVGDLERSRRGQIARMLRDAGASRSA